MQTKWGQFYLLLAGSYFYIWFVFYVSLPNCYSLIYSSLIISDQNWQNWHLMSLVTKNFLTHTIGRSHTGLFKFALIKNHPLIIIIGYIFSEIESPFSPWCLAGCTSMKIKFTRSKTKFLSFYESLIVTLCTKLLKKEEILWWKVRSTILKMGHNGHNVF